MHKTHSLFSILLLVLAAMAPAATALASSAQTGGADQVRIAAMPPEVASSHFMVTINGRTSAVMHAAANYYLLNFEMQGPVQITVTADDPHFWDAGVEVQPMRLGIRPRRNGASINFTLDAPAKVSITRPGDFSGTSEMLFLFANAPEMSRITAETPGIRYYGPGIHRESIDAKSGDHIYIAAGAVIFGSLNIWQVHDVSVSGEGTIIYDGPQDPDHDEGWMHKPNWHVIVMDNAHNIRIEGITGIVRSRTWMVQMRDSRGIVFRNVKIIGGSTGNANQDGMDWLGGGDTLVQDSFFRAADDIFAMYGNWDGYTAEALAAPGHEVSRITIENSVLSTSISNVVRIGWPRKIFDSHDFTLRDSDVIQMGVGGCGVPFALFEIWADPDGKGEHSGIRLQNIRLDNWYSLVQVRQPNPGIRDVSFANIWSMDGPGMVPSVLKGDVSQVSFQGVDLGAGGVLKNSDLPLEITDGASLPQYAPATVEAGFTYSAKHARPGESIKFTVGRQQPGAHYRWLFGDGDTVEGPTVRHAFADAEGTLLDGSGRFRVLLSASDSSGHQSWSSQSVVVANQVQAATRAHDLQPGLEPSAEDAGKYQGFVRVPSPGGYTFTLLTSTTASLMIDGLRVNSGKLQPQVCGSPGDAVQAMRLSASMARGLHRITIARGSEKENAEDPARPLLLWEGPGLTRQRVPASALFHADVSPR